MVILDVVRVERTGVVLEAFWWLSPPGFIGSSRGPSGDALFGCPSGTPAGPFLLKTGILLDSSVGVFVTV